MYEPVINRVELPCRGVGVGVGGGKLNMPSVKVLINSSTCEVRETLLPASCQNRHFSEHSSSSVHLKVEFLCNSTGGAGGGGVGEESRQLFVRTLLSIIAAIKIEP